MDIEDEFFTQKPAILVKRGGCAFVKKTLNVQRLGGSITVIMDTHDEQEENVIMVDVNSLGDLVHIPTYMISYSDGTHLVEAFNTYDIMVRSSLEINHVENYVEYELFYTSPFEFDTLDLLELEEVQFQLYKTAYFMPRMITW